MGHFCLNSHCLTRSSLQDSAVKWASYVNEPHHTCGMRSLWNRWGRRLFCRTFETKLVRQTCNPLSCSSTSCFSTSHLPASDWLWTITKHRDKRGTYACICGSYALNTRASACQVTLCASDEPGVQRSPSRWFLYARLSSIESSSTINVFVIDHINNAV